MTAVVVSTPFSAQELPQGLPRMLGNHELLFHLARGGMADVYVARSYSEEMDWAWVVVKQLRSELQDDKRFAAVLQKEAWLHRFLPFASVVQGQDLFEPVAEPPYLVLEYVEGYDLNILLRKLTERRIPFPTEFLFFIVGQVLRALEHVHNARDNRGRPLHIVHRDVSPANVLLSLEGEVKLCDFGVAHYYVQTKEANHDAAFSHSTLVGKSAYMAPEHAQGQMVDRRADLFSVGILLWELCAGRRLVRGNEEEMLAQAKAGAVPPLPERGLPEHAALERIVEQALAFDPNQRFQTAADFRRALTAYVRKAKLRSARSRLAAFMREHFAQEIRQRKIVPEKEVRTSYTREISRKFTLPVEQEIELPTQAISLSAKRTLWITGVALLAATIAWLITKFW